jgi:ABC-type transport system substrate-binding protein
VPLFRSGKILANYYNGAFDGMVDQAQTIMDPKRRAELYHRLMRRLWVDDAAAMLLYQQLDRYGATRRTIWKARGDEQIKGFDMAVKDAR